MADFDRLSDDQERALSALFKEVRDQEAPPSSELMSRILADAAEVMPAMAPAPVLPKARRGLGDILRQFGGLPGASVMTACALFGVVLGYAGPDSVLGLTGLSDYTVSQDLDTDIDVFEMSDFSFDESELLQ